MRLDTAPSRLLGAGRVAAANAEPTGLQSTDQRRIAAWPQGRKAARPQGRGCDHPAIWESASGLLYQTTFDVLGVGARGVCPIRARVGRSPEGWADRPLARSRGVTESRVKETTLPTPRAIRYQVAHFALRAVGGMGGRRFRAYQVNG